MNDFFQQLKKEALTTKLSHDEKQGLRVALYDAMRQPRAVVQEVHYTRVRSSYVWFSPRFALPVAVLLVAGLGTGTAFAAQGALPGDPLYAIKINAVEPALGALAIGTEAKAQWHAQVAQTRLEEAEELAVAGILNAATSAELAENFDEHNKEAEALAQKVDDEHPGFGAELTAQFDSSLAAHSSILSRLGKDDGIANKQFADDIAWHVRGQGLATAQTMSSVQTFSAPTVATPEQASASSTKLKNASASALADAQEAFDASKSSLDASTTLAIEAEFVRIGAEIDAATSTASLTGALKDATVLKEFLKASKKFNRNLFHSSSFVPTSPAIETQVQVRTSDSGSDSNRGDSGGGEQEKKQGDDDSFVHNLLNDF